MKIGSDCILYEGRAEEVLPLIQAESVDLTVTSPPYDNLRTYNGNSVFDFEKIAVELLRVTKRGGVVVWIVGDATIDGSESGTSFRQALKFMEIGFKLHDTMIYEKNGASYPSQDKYYQTFEFMFVLSKGKPKTVNLLRDRKNIWGKSWGVRSRRDVQGNLVKAEHIVGDEFGARFNIWRYNTGAGFTTKDKEAYGHPAIFPDALPNDHIATWTNGGDLVLDPFAGSGTTGKAAKLRGRKSILIEVDSSSISLIKKRLSNTQPLFDQSVPAITSTNCT